MSSAHETHDLSAPRPSAAEIRAMLETELSLRARIGYTLLLLFDLTAGAAIASLWATEPALPPRAQVAFALITAIAIAWAVFFAWTLGRRKVLLAGHRVISARIAVAGTAVYTAGALLLGITQEDVREPAFFAAALGAFMLVAAIAWLVRGKKRLADLLGRRKVLENALAARLILPFALLLCCGALSAQVLTPAPLDVLVPYPPVSAPALGANHLVHEVHVTNFGTNAVRLRELSIAGLASWKEGELERRTNTGSLTLAPGQRLVVFVWIPLRQNVPSQITHEVVTVAEDGKEHRLAIAPIAVSTAQPILTVSPVGAGTWVALRGPSSSSGHRRSLVALDGRVRVPQRFAVDWAKLGEDGRLFEGDGARNEQWRGYDTPVFAAASGRVVKVVDAIADGEPRTGSSASHSRETVAGNHVIIDCGQQRFAVYAHLRRGSIAVKEGEPVAAGQTIGRIGNSGHSLAPHLHFHVGDAPDALASEGLPFVLSSFRLAGRIDSVPRSLAGEAWRPEPHRPARDVTREMPLENMVIVTSSRSESSSSPSASPPD